MFTMGEPAYGIRGKHSRQQAGRRTILALFHFHFLCSLLFVSFSFPFLSLFFPLSFLSLRFVATSSHPARPHFDGLVSVAWGLGRVEGGKGREGGRGERREEGKRF